MSTEISTKNLKQAAEPVIVFAQRYIRFIYFVAFTSVCIFLVLQINRYASVEPTDDEVTEQLQTIQRPHIDADSINKIQQLQDQNVEVQTLFQDARDNPFSE